MAVTFTLNVHDAPDPRVAPDRLMLLPPAVAAIVPPPHEPVNPLGIAICNPEGNLSMKSRAVSGVFGLESENVRVVVSPTPIDPRAKASVRTGGTAAAENWNVPARKTFGGVAAGTIVGKSSDVLGS